MGNVLMSSEGTSRSDLINTVASARCSRAGIEKEPFERFPLADNEKPLETVQGLLPKILTTELKPRC